MPVVQTPAKFLFFHCRLVVPMLLALFWAAKPALAQQALEPQDARTAALYWRASCALLKASPIQKVVVQRRDYPVSCEDRDLLAAKWPVLRLSPELTDTAVLVWDVPAGNPPFVAVNPALLSDLGVAEVLALFTHELAHHVLGHSELRDKLDGITGSLGHMKFILDGQELDADLLAAKAMRTEGYDLCVVQQSLNAAIAKTVGRQPYELEQRNMAVCQTTEAL